MAPMRQQSNYSSSNFDGEAVVRQANVLASCYIVDSAATLRGLHYCTTGAAGLPSPPSSPPLAAITASNQLALLPKATKQRQQPECERFFCESMKAVFRGERGTGPNGSGLTGVYSMQTPPSDEDLAVQPHFGGRETDTKAPAPATAWMEVWDFAGGASFRAFVADDGAEKSLFALFDRNVIGRDLKPALMALMELVDGPLDCQHLVICIDRGIEEEDAKSLMKSLQWVGFELTTLDRWAHDVDVTSNRWLFMGMEI
ncbi:ornithine decarboxylase antizyme [Colletotrichum gloeosporioides Cg-14]|uniref:Ornithine decarboxylase antizyme n=1 Tax=Colletotrichum gloeosporioides (strain Cg-14) TaxID=1237896 RepID=T0KXQ8_COLGC|nr:ornithine decarboxylase antizyme [Colletotrichum gloeosporioides Cg-14]